MNILRKIILGFLWGIGFSIACFLVSTTYVIHVLPQVENISSDNHKERIKRSIFSQYDELSPKVVSTKLDGPIIETIVALKPSYGPKKFMSLAYFDNNNEFITVCDERLPVVATENELHYFKVYCPISDSNLKPVSVQVTLRL